jgi:hypothetical protein
VPAVPAGIVALIVVELVTLTPVAALPPMVTVAPVTKLVPVMVTLVPPVVEPEFGDITVTVGTPTTVNALLNVWAPPIVPVIIIFCNPADTEGTVIVPDSAPLLFTTRVLVAVVIPTFTPEMVSESAHPVPVTVMVEPTFPEVGLKLAVAAVIVKLVLNIWTPLSVSIMLTVWLPVPTEGTVIVPVRAPLPFAVKESMAAIPPTVTL